MAFNFHHLKVDYEDGQKWTITPFDFEELKRLYHTSVSYTHLLREKLDRLNKSLD